MPDGARDSTATIFCSAASQAYLDILKGAAPRNIVEVRGTPAIYHLNVLRLWVRPAMATTEQSTRPILMRRQRRAYGRCDYERFDHFTTSHINAGRGRIGEVEVDCRFFFTKSRWGFLGSDYGSAGTPGGIIYLDLDFHQPSDCRLRAATVVVTLTDQDDEHQRTRLHRPSGRVKFTSHYGPRHIRGAERQMQKRIVKQFTPHVEVMGQGVGGVGLHSEKLLTTTSRWNFSGHLGSTRGSHWDNKLKWVLEENLHEDQSMHSNVIHTAFAFEHNATQFFMTVKVTGKLVRTRDQLRQSLRFKGQEKAVTIKFEWKEGYSCPALLDDMAKNLHLTMEQENRCSVPAEIPDALPVNFIDTSQPVCQTPRATLEPNFKDGMPAKTQTSIPGIMGPPQMVPAPSDDMMRLAAGLTLAPSLEPADLSSGRSGTAIENDQTAVNSAASPRMRRARSSSYQPSQLSAATTLVEEDEEGKEKEGEEKEVPVPGFIFSFAWLGQLLFHLLDYLARLFGFSLVITLGRGGNLEDINRARTGKDPQKSGDVSEHEAEHPRTLMSSPADKRDMKSGEFEETAGSTGTSTPMSVARSEMRVPRKANC